MKALAQRTMQSVLARSWRLLIAATFVAAGSADASAQSLACPKSPSSASGRSFQNQNLALVNFSRLDLTNANFRGATLKGVSFIRANLTGADFSGATFADTDPPGRNSDFSFARLDSACFIGAKFLAPTYFTYATLTSVDFSQTDISNGNAIFGDQPLIFDATATARPSFRSTVMNCEFVAKWNQLDLTGADVRACGSQLATPSGTTTGHDFSGGVYRNVAFDGLNLAGSTWKNAIVAGASFRGSTLDGATGLNSSDLTVAVFSQASLREVNLSGATLSGTVFDEANLENANLQGANLSPCIAPATCGAASLRGAWLKNVNLVGSHLEYAVFSNASFYSTVGAGSGSCDAKAGNCASANGATLTNTDFSEAYLFGVDFGNAVMHGVKFDGAVLVAANFAGATVSPEPNAVNGSFANAFLQGASLDSAVLDGVDFSGAFFDFRPDGNTMRIQLNTKHTKFAGWKAKDQKVCIQVTYGKSASVPPSQARLTCPDNNPASPATGCGPVPPIDPSTSHWNNHSNIAINDPAASYKYPATFTPASADLCERNIAW